eukprot:CAMPEP_0114127898 /NCGR_PEP_ID=MMETSP0043_2-20121206/10643_1 /TAXON_ID=464988 /ORGANISM="Hemiselmis andersenii, Strain CCMP644" /LENGTH=69 /DNA_ID=CAMNT_0001221049 /DNA_START=177 /DNA_END=383 /DNA_ORIENTATION=+
MAVTPLLTLGWSGLENVVFGRAVLLRVPGKATSVPVWCDMPATGMWSVGRPCGPLCSVLYVVPRSTSSS